MSCEWYVANTKTGCFYISGDRSCNRWCLETAPETSPPSMEPTLSTFPLGRQRPLRQAGCFYTPGDRSYNRWSLESELDNYPSVDGALPRYERRWKHKALWIIHINIRCFPLMDRLMYNWHFAHIQYNAPRNTALQYLVLTYFSYKSADNMCVIFTAQ